MMHKLFAVSTAILSLTAAVPSALAPGTKSLEKTARFENKEGIPAAVIGPVGIYEDIFWNGMALVAPLIPTTILGITPRSSPNFIGFSPTTLATLQQGQPSMTVRYAGSQVDSFDLKEFYYGCALATKQSLVTLPTSCSIIVQGFAQGSTTPKATKEFKFAVKLGQMNAQMQLAELDSSFTGLERADFFFKSDVADTLTTVTAATLDSINYVVYQN